MSGTLLKRDSIQHRRLPVHIAKFLRTASFIEHLWWLNVWNFIKKRLHPTQASSCTYSEIFKNSFFYRTPLVAASDPMK